MSVIFPFPGIDVARYLIFFFVFGAAITYLCTSILFCLVGEVLSMSATVMYVTIIITVVIVVVSMRINFEDISIGHS